MFGFINIYKNELKIKDYNLFRAYYCGLCKSLGKRHNQLSRLGLSYDLTFLAIVADSLSDQEPVTENTGCIKHIGMHSVCTNNKAIDYASDMSIILTYHKLTDDITDDRSIKAFLARLAYIRSFRRVSRKYPDISERIKQYLRLLSDLERQRCPSVDMAADPFAKLTMAIFEGFSPNLAALGYNIGRFIYIADAYKDIEEDKKNNSYNPFLHYDADYLNSMDFINRAKGTFNMNLSAIATDYRELKIYKNKEILDNIIFIGLRYITEQLFCDNGGKK